MGYPERKGRETGPRYRTDANSTLSIRITEESNVLVVVIEDDGIGREAAIRLRSENFPTHKPMGIKLTEERLALINEHHLTAVDIQDLYNNNEPSGTRVIMRVVV